MNIKILLIALSAAAFSSCNTAYKSTQTPDDVYYSPTKGIEEENNHDKDEVKNESAEDRQIHMSTRDRRWRDLDNDYDSNYDPYHYGYSYGYYYNPYYCHAPVYAPGAVFLNPKNSTPRMANLGGYNNSINVMVNQKTGSTKWVTSERPYNNSNGKTTFVRKIITPSSNNSSSSGNNTRTYTPSGSSSSSSSNSSSGKSVSRPSRN